MKFGLRCCLLLAVLAPAIASSGSSRNIPKSLAFVTPTDVGTPVSAIHAFRLGTAGRPFAWSTALGDFDGDGTPDLVIADRVGRVAGGFGYRLQLTVSQVGSRTVAFQSSYPALSVRALDVDNDRDTDLIVEAVPSGPVVGVWINDGRGRFARSGALGVRAQGGGPSKFTDGRYTAEPFACVAAHRPGDVAAPDSYRTLSPIARFRRASTRTHSSVAWLTLAAEPRAPPPLQLPFAG